jgi:hypothetical protein
MAHAVPILTTDADFMLMRRAGAHLVVIDS